MAQDYPLPDGWKWTTIGEVCTFEYGKGLTEAKRDSRGTIPVFGSNGIVGYHSLSLVNKPCLIIGRKGAAGAVHKTQVPCWPIDTTYYVIPPDTISLSFLYYLFSSLVLNSLDRSTAIPGLNRNDAYALKIPLPPLSEQERIVAKIEELFTQLDAGTAALRRVQAELKRYKASVLKAACKGRLVPQDPSDEPAEELLRRMGKTPLVGDGLPSLPEGWCWTRVGDIAENRLGKMLDKEKNIGELRPYLRNLNVRWFEFDLTDIKFLRVMDKEIENISIQKGDLVVCEGGEPGRAAVWNRDEHIIIQKALHRVRPSKCILPTYLSYCLATDVNTGQLDKYFTGSTIKHFTGESLRSYVIPLPSLAEQSRIVAEVEFRLSLVAEIDSTVKTMTARSARLRQAILKRAFEGRLVEQISEHEPELITEQMINKPADIINHQALQPDLFD